MIPLLACAALLGCRDTLGPDAHAEGGGARFVGEYACTASVGQAVLSCAPVGPPPSQPGGPSRLLLGQGKVKLTSSNVHYDSVSGIFGFDVTVQNLIAEAIGTPDGTTVSGIKVFYSSGPTVTAYVSPGDTGHVTVANPDGVGNFTAHGQPYHFYNQILAPGAVTPTKNWQLHMLPSVKTFAFQVMVFTASASEKKVPASPPDSIPESIFDSAFVTRDTTYSSLDFLRNVLVVSFVPGITDEDRQAALDMVNGEVVGGIPNGVGGGEYLVRITDNGTTGPLFSAIATLQARTDVVALVQPYFLGDAPVPMYRRPADGPGFTQWQVLPDSADGTNWALEAISAPLAWGCATGTRDSAVAVVDHGFVSAPGTDFTGNLGVALGAGGFPSDTHGTGVASVIAARGNDGQQMTGVMWDATLRLYEMQANASGTPLTAAQNQQTGFANTLARITAAMRGGASVINLSIGTNWNHTPGSRPTDEADVERTHQRLKTVVMQMDAAGYRPLFVIAAGNETADAKWNAYARLRNDLPSRVLVVAAARRTSQTAYALYGTSNFGTLVDLAAPGDSVTSLVNSGALAYGFETSFATPLVSGAAGLLKSFDPRLTAADLKTYLVRGAVRGGRTAGGFPVLNAYAALKASAERSGAPLCGNAVYQNAGGQVLVYRDSTLTTTEPLLTTSDSLRDALHGGRRLRFASGAGYGWQLSGASSAWVGLGATPDTVANATQRSRAGTSHDGDSVFTVTKRAGTNARYDEVYDVRLNGNVLFTIPETKTPKIDNMPAVNRCVKWPLSGSEWTDCVSESPVYSRRILSRVTIAYSSTRHEVVILVAMDSTGASVDLAEYVGSGYWERTSDYGSVSSGTYFLSVPLSNPGNVTTRHINLFATQSAGVSEDGKYLLAMRANYSLMQSWAGTDAYAPLNSRACDAAYYRIDAATLTRLASLPSVLNVSTCHPSASFGP